MYDFLRLLHEMQRREIAIIDAAFSPDQTDIAWAKLDLLYFLEDQVSLEKYPDEEDWHL